MPRLARLYVKTSLGYLVAALLLGAALTPPFLRHWPALSALQPAQVHLFVVGWLTQLIFGVAYWLFPRHSRERPHGNPRLPTLAYGALNLGLVLRLIAEPAITWNPAAIWPWMLGTAALLQWLAGTVFAAYLWTRVKRK